MMTFNTTSDIIAAINTLQEIPLEQLQALDQETIFDLEDKASYIMHMFRTVAAQKRAMSNQESDIAIAISEQEKIMDEKSNINATIKAFDMLDVVEKNKLINLGIVYHAARRINNFAGMEKIKTMILANLVDLNLGNMFVCAHVIACAR